MNASEWQEYIQRVRMQVIKFSDGLYDVYARPMRKFERTWLLGEPSDKMWVSELMKNLNLLGDGSRSKTTEEPILEMFFEEGEFRSRLYEYKEFPDLYFSSYDRRLSEEFDDYEIDLIEQLNNFLRNNQVRKYRDICLTQMQRLEDTAEDDPDIIKLKTSLSILDSLPEQIQDFVESERKAFIDIFSSREI